VDKLVDRLSKTSLSLIQLRDPKL